MASGEDDSALATRRALQQLCGGYAELADEAAEFPQPVDERIGLALFKIDEACAVTDRLRADAAQAQTHMLEALVANCNELEDIFLRINLIEVRRSFVRSFVPVECVWARLTPDRSAS